MRHGQALIRISRKNYYKLLQAMPKRSAHSVHIWAYHNRMRQHIICKLKIETSEIWPSDLSSENADHDFQCYILHREAQIRHWHKKSHKETDVQWSLDFRGSDFPLVFKIINVKKKYSVFCFLTSPVFLRPPGVYVQYLGEKLSKSSPNFMDTEWSK